MSPPPPSPQNPAPGAGWQPPREFDEYRLLRPLGRGRTGHVYLAHDTLLERTVAVKFIPALDDETLSRFLVEARAAARLQHPNVATLYRAGQFEDLPYLVSEYIRGTSLDRLPRPQPWQRVLDIGIGLARGLAAAHRRNVLHRDIKPANAILDESGEVKLLDFGLAKLLDAPPEAPGDAPDSASGSAPEVPESSHPLELPTLTHGAVVGTPYFMSPESWRGEPASVRSDLFSLGALLHELAAGQGPFRHVPLKELPHALQEQEARPLLPAAPGVDPRFAAAVDRCLRREPTERFASADALLEALEELRARDTAPPIPEGNPYRGLNAFQEEHRALFFGRRQEVRAVLERLRANAFVLVTGDSGVGKSSLCLAGVLPHVREGALEDGLSWSVARMVPGRRPVATLAAALAPHVGQEEARLEQLARAEPTTLVRALRSALGEGVRRGVVLHVDQLEELVTLSEPTEAALMAELLGQLASGVTGVRLLATSRSDFLTRLGALPGLGEALSRALYLLRPLGRAEVREVVTGPARAKGAHFESEALIDTLVESTLRAEGSLPLLQFTLAELWEARDQKRGIIPAAALEALGGVSGALARYADGVIAQLLPDQQGAARQLLMRLVTVDGTRARRTEAELLGQDPASRAALEALIRARLVMVRRAEEGTTFDIAHEALLTGWPTLAQWLAEANEARQLHARLEHASAEWERMGRPREALWGARRLAEIGGLAPESLTPREASFLEASRGGVRRGRMLTRVLAAGFVASLALVYAGLRIHAWYKLEGRVRTQLSEARSRLEHARERDRALEAARTEAFTLFDAGKMDEARPRWAEALRMQTGTQQAYAQASEEMEKALVLDPGREEVRGAFADVLAERAWLAERAFRTSERDELLQRLRLYDPPGERLARFEAPLRVKVRTRPAGATVTLARYEPASDGRRVLTAARQAGTTPVEGLSLERGTWVVELSAPGYAPVRHVLRAEPGPERTLEVALPEAASVPEGFIYVPRGTFLFGTAADENIRQFFDTTPLHEVETGPYLISRTEVTYGEYVRWLEALPPEERTRRTPHGAKVASLNAEVELKRLADGRWHLSIHPNGVTYAAPEGEPLRYTTRPNRVEQDWRRLPVGAIDYADAKAYAAWLAQTGRVPGARLCNELEWERAARGADEREYPHGDVLLPHQANYDETYGKVGASFGPDEVSSHPESRSPFGLDDMVGNVFEWTDSIFQPGRSAARGGSYYFGASTGRSPNRETPEPGFRDLSVGLRLCADAS
ncbi:SUMF1/EgtB/PvdO family nonheme iron enzyme [Archangium violaceum]|uniref:nSTAND1 domain-containing NTPase n=1 Tax=Archangium violaceum TaxID=83451 RepID=UPI002B2B55E6|nr:SUMF1/EgtB/PvdO family nonheme iron enzyme [Archangium gephyra]